MVWGLIFAGGIGERMNSRAKPKQFLEIYGKPIIVYTIEYFENHPEVDHIVVSCLEEWIPRLEAMLERYAIKKVVKIVPGGSTGHESIYNGLKVINEMGNGEDIVLIHDGVRPLITSQLITDNIEVTREKGNAITISEATESLAQVDEEGSVSEMPERSKMRMVRAPQTFYVKDIWAVHEKAMEDGYLSIDSASLLKHYGYALNTVVGNSYNIKITSPSDYYIFRSIYEAQENLQIFGI